MTFLHMVTPTRRDNIAPVVAAAATTRHNVVNCVSLAIAVGASMVIAQQHGAASNWWRAHSRRQLHDVMETDNGGNLNGQ